MLEVRGSYTGVGGDYGHQYILGRRRLAFRQIGYQRRGPAATGNTMVHVTNVGGPGAETTNGILVVNATSGATTAPGAFTLANPELRAGRLRL